MTTAEEDGDYEGPSLSMVADAADMLTSGETLVIPLDTTVTSPSRVLGIMTSSQVAMSNTTPVQYLNPAAKFDEHYEQFTIKFNEAIGVWDAIEAHDREGMLNNLDGKFYSRLNSAYDHAKEMLSVLSERTFCNQKNTENYRNKLIGFIKQLAIVLGREEPAHRISGI